MIEDLTHDDYLSIANILPMDMSFADLDNYVLKVSVSFLLPVIDAKAAVFIAYSIIRYDGTISNYETIKRCRIAEVVEFREKNQSKINSTGLGADC